MKAVLTSLNTTFLPTSHSRFKQREISMLITITTVLAVLCKFLGDFWAFWERDIFSQRMG